jgi:hypothetical protein
MKEKMWIFPLLFMQSAYGELVSSSSCCPEIIEDCCTCIICPPTTEITPKGGPCVQNSSNFYLTGDFIYWNATEENLEFAVTNVLSSLVEDGGFGPKGKIYQIDSNWAPGFKVGAGYDFCFDGWDIYAEYTWFHATKKESTAPLNSSLSLNDAYWLLNDPSLFITNDVGITQYGIPGASASEKWHLAFNQIDLVLGRNFYISRRLLYRPFVGLKGMWSKQQLNVDFQGVILNGAPAPFLAFASMKNKIDSWAIGMFTGLEGSWLFSRNFSLIGNLGFAGLWQHFKVSRFDTQFVPPALNRGFVNLGSQFNKFTPVIEWMLGLRWEFWLNCDTYHLSFDAGWEAQNWFSQNKFIRVAGSPKCDGDLAFQGLTFKTRFDF